MRWGMGLAAAIVLAGCGESPDYNSLGLIDVTGKVTLDDRPLADAQVAFHGTDGHTPMARTGASGEYRLMYDSRTPGCTPGSKVVRITAAAGNAEGADPEGTTDEGVPLAGTEPIPAEYNRQSILKAEVSADQRVFNFDLKSKP